VTLSRDKSGRYIGDFRHKGIPRLRLSLGTDDKDTAREAYEAVRKLFRQRRVEMIDQLRLPRSHPQKLTVERLMAMVEHHEPLKPMDAPAPGEAASQWGTVLAEIGRYLEWLEAHPKKSKGTVNTARAQLARFARFQAPETGGRAIGGLALEEVTAPMIEAYQRAFVAAETPLNTITAYMGRVRALWRWVEKSEGKRARLARVAPTPVYSPVDSEMLISETTGRQRVLLELEASRILAACPAPLLFPVACGLLAGMRLGEVLHLRTYEDIDLELGMLAVQRQPDWRPKTRASERRVPIASGLRPILERHLERYASERWVVPMITDADRPFREQAFPPHFNAIVTRAGLVAGRRDPRGVTFHTLRHTFASWLAMRGVNILTIAQLLGDSVAMVEKVYAHLSPDYRSAAVERLAGSVTLPDLGGEEE
jgi:integrase